MNMPTHIRTKPKPCGSTRLGKPAQSLCATHNCLTGGGEGAVFRPYADREHRGAEDREEGGQQRQAQAPMAARRSRRQPRRSWDATEIDRVQPTPAVAPARQ